jgi:hypothetical protein
MLKDLHGRWEESMSQKFWHTYNQVHAQKTKNHLAFSWPTQVIGAFKNA